MIFKMFSVNDVGKSNLHPYDDLEEGEIIEDDSESIGLYEVEHYSTTLHNYIQNDSKFLSVSNECALNAADSTGTASNHDNLHQSRTCLPKQTPIPSLHTKSMLKMELTALDWRHSRRKSCKSSSFKAKKYYGRRSPSVSSLSNCSCSSCCSPQSSEEFKTSSHLKGGRQFSRKCSSKSSQGRGDKKILLKVKKEQKFTNTVRKKESNYSKHSDKKNLNFTIVKTKNALNHSPAYQKTVDARFVRRREELLQNYGKKNKSGSQHCLVPKKRDDLHQCLSPSLINEESSHIESTKMKDLWNDVKTRSSVKSKLIPGSLGEMLLKNQIKLRLKTRKPSVLVAKSNDSNSSSTPLIRTSNDVDLAKNCELTNLNEATVKNSIGLKDDDDDEDELTLRYKALQSAVKSCGSSLFKSNLNRILNTTKKDVNKIANVCTGKSSQQIIVLGDDNAKDGFESINESQTSKDKCEAVLIDMEISNDSINDAIYLNEDEKQRNLKIDRSFIKADQFYTKVKSVSSKEPEVRSDAVNQDSQFPFPIEWAYMIPPPPQPGQPDNNLNSVNSWCFNQNMYVQSMEETHANEVNQDMAWQPMEMAQSSAESYGVYSHPYQFAYQSSNVSDTRHVPNIQEGNFEVNARALHCQQPGENVRSAKLRNTHAEQYRTFMSTFLHNSCQGFFNKKEKHRDLVEINLKPLAKGKSPRTSNIHLKTVNRSLPNKRKVRRRRRSTRKNVLGENIKNAPTTLALKAASSSFSSNKNMAKENNLVVEEEDEDILRAQLLNDMALKNKSMGFSLSENKKDPAKVMSQDNIGAPQMNTVSQKTKIPVKRVSSFPLKQSRKWLKNERAPKATAAFKQPVKTVPQLDFGGRYLDPKNSFGDVPKADGFSLSKFPFVKPVIIPLGNNSESESSEAEVDSPRVQSKKTCESVISGICELIKSCRNSQVKTVKGKEAANGQTLQSVHHLSKERQEEYRKLKALLVTKNTAIQQRKKSSVKAGFSEDGHAAASFPSTVQPEAKLQNESSERSETDKNRKFAKTEGRLPQIREVFTHQESEHDQITKEEGSSSNCTGTITKSLKENSRNISNIGSPIAEYAVSSSCLQEKEFSLSQEEELCLPQKDHCGSHSYSKKKEVADCTAVEITPSGVLLQETDINARFSDKICRRSLEEVSVSSEDTEQEDDEDDSSSSSGSSSSSSEDSDSESDVDQIEIALRNKLLQKRRELLKLHNTILPSDAFLRETPSENAQVFKEAGKSTKALLDIEPHPETNRVTCGMINTIELDNFKASEKVDDTDMPKHRFLHSNLGCSSDKIPTLTKEFGQPINKHVSEDSDLSETDHQMPTADSSENLGKFDEKDSFLKCIKTAAAAKEKDCSIHEVGNHPVSENDKQPNLTAKAVTSPQKNRVTVAALMRSLKDTNLKTRIMRGEHRKHLRKQIEEEIKKKDLSRRMFTSRIRTLLEEATTKDNLCQGLFTQIVKLFSQIDALQKERKEKITAMSVTVAKTAKLLQKLEEDIRTLKELHKLGKQVVSSDDEVSSIPHLCLSADEEHRKSFVQQMNTLQHNLQLTVTQENLLWKAFVSRFSPRSNHRSKIKREYLPTAGAATRKFKVDNRPLPCARTELEVGGVGIPSGLPPATAAPASCLIMRTPEQLLLPYHLTSVIGQRKEEENALEKVSVVSLPMEDDRDKLVQTGDFSSSFLYAALHKEGTCRSVEDLGILCPHDLLGRCNDDFCVYQHTSAASQVRGDSNSPAASGASCSQMVPVNLHQRFEEALEDSSQPSFHFSSNYPGIESKTSSTVSEVSTDVKDHLVDPCHQKTTSENCIMNEENGENTSARNNLSKDLTDVNREKNSLRPAVVSPPQPSREKRKSGVDVSVLPQNKKKSFVDSIDCTYTHNSPEEDGSTTQGSKFVPDVAVCPLLFPLCNGETVDSGRMDAESSATPSPHQSIQGSLRRKLRRGRARFIRPLRSSRRIQERLKKN